MLEGAILVFGAAKSLLSPEISIQRPVEIFQKKQNRC
jgi:hypothetical protein